MADFIANTAYDMRELAQTTITIFDEGTPIESTATNVTVEYLGVGAEPDEILTLTGSGFADQVEGYPTTGLITGAEYYVDGVLVLTMSSLAMTVEEFIGYLQAEDTAGLLASLFAGADMLTGSSGADVLVGFTGADRLDGGAGADEMEGGAGNDVYLVDNVGDTIVETAGNGIDTVESSLSYSLGTELENLVLLTGAGNGIGNDLDNVMTGNAAGNELVGRDGNDTLFGNEGGDVLRGQVGNDALWGGLGHDDLFGGGGNDTLEGEGGNDRVYGNAGDDFVNGGAGNDNVFGGGGNDNVQGGDGADIINGHAGNDLIVGGPGNDLLVGGPGADRFLFNPGHLGGSLSATDRIKDFSHAQGDKIDFHNLDADTTTGGNQAFSWIGGAAFSGAAGELRFAFAGNTTTITGDTNGDGTADFALWLTGQIGLVADDFVL